MPLKKKLGWENKKESEIRMNDQNYEKWLQKQASVPTNTLIINQNY